MKKKFSPRLCVIIFLQLLIACEPDDNPQRAPDTPQPVVIERDRMIEMSWDAIDGVVLYRIYWSGNENFTLQTASDFRETGDTRFTHDQLENGTTYYYRITAISPAGESPASPVMPASPAAPPGKPVSLIITPLDSALQISWNSQPSAISYALTIATDSNMFNTNIYRNAESPFIIKPLVNGQQYYISLTASNGSGDSQASTPVSSIPTKLYALASGYEHNCAIKPDRSLWCWGRNQFGQTGTGTSSEYPLTAPEKVSDADVQTWETISAGETSTCGIDTSGQLWCWGDNTFYQLGNGTTQDSVTPSLVTSDTNWVNVASGAAHYCAIKADGSLWCWGWNSEGQTGTGSFGAGAGVTVPTRVGEDINWIKLSLGNVYSCALKSDHTLWCWGKLPGSQNPSPATSPERVTGDTDWSLVTVGGQHACAIKTGGSLWCWGLNDYGQVGNGLAGNSAFELLPVRVGTDTDWTVVKGIGDTTCALKSGNSLWCWGYNAYGQLGDGTQVNKYVPVRIGTKLDWAYLVETAGNHTCAVNRAGDIFCWGLNRHGELGIGGEPRPGTQDSWVPVLTENSNNWTQVSSGYNHQCASQSDNSIYCWGVNNAGQLGRQTYISKAVPSRVVGIKDWQSVHSSNSGDTVCGLKLDGTLWCWGRGVEGQFGNGNSGTDNFSRIPVLVNQDTDWMQVAPGYTHICAIKTNNTLWCWGDTAYGKVGTGSGVNPTEPFPMQVGLDSNWLSVALGEWHTCGIKTDNSLWCWGDNTAGGIGHGVDPGILSFTEPVSLGDTRDWASVTLGSGYTCALKLDASAWCWGFNSSGQTSDNVLESNRPAINVMPGSSWTHITAGYQSTCGIQSSQTLWCWGLNDYGQLGLNHKLIPPTPGHVAVGSLWQDVGIGNQHACGIKTDGTLWCWGSNLNGALGDDSAWKLTPQLVLFP